MATTEHRTGAAGTRRACQINSAGLVFTTAVAAAVVIAIAASPGFAADPPKQIPPVEKPVQFARPQFHAAILEVDPFIHVIEARNTFRVSGAGLTLAVLDPACARCTTTSWGAC